MMEWKEVQLNKATYKAYPFATVSATDKKLIGDFKVLCLETLPIHSILSDISKYHGIWKRKWYTI